jgi:hypothetical protein
MAQLLPLSGYALVLLSQGKYEHIAAQTKVYETASTGDVVKLNTIDLDVYGDLLGCRVFWQELSAVSPIHFEGKDFAFVKLTEIMGYAQPN